MDTVQIDLESSDKESPSSRKTVSLKEFVPVGTFAGANDFVVRIRDGRPIPADSGDQGGGQN